MRSSKLFTPRCKTNLRKGEEKTELSKSSIPTPINNTNKEREQDPITVIINSLNSYIPPPLNTRQK